MSDMKINDVLAQLRAVAAQNGLRQAAEPTEAQGTDFASVIKESIDNVNERQQKARGMAEAFELGDPNVDLSQVMIEMQKARVSFEALSQVRNKVVAAYQEIMNMPV